MWAPDSRGVFDGWPRGSDRVSAGGVGVLLAVEGAEDHAGGDGVVGLFIDQHKTSGDAVGGVGIAKDRGGEAEANAADIVHTELDLILDFFQRGDVHFIDHFLDHSADLAGGVAEVEAAASFHFFLGEPADHRINVLGDEWWRVWFGEKIATADIDFICQLDGVRQGW